MARPRKFPQILRRDSISVTIYKTKTSGRAMVWVIVPSKDGSSGIDVRLVEDGDVVTVTGTVAGRRIEAVIPTRDGKPSLNIE